VSGGGALTHAPSLYEFGVAQVVGLALRQKMIIGVVTGVIITCAVALLNQVPVRYTATTLLMVDTSSQRLVNPESTYNASTTPGAVDSEVEVLASPKIARDVLNRLDLRNDTEFNRPGIVGRLKDRLLGAPTTDPTPEELEQRTLDRLRGRVSIRHPGITSIISIAVESEDKQKAALIANTYADVYIEDQINNQVLLIDRAEKALSQRVSDLSSSVRRDEQKVDTFLLENASSLLQGGEAASALSELLSEIKKEMDKRSSLDLERTKILSLREAGAYRELADHLNQASPLSAQMDRRGGSVSGSLLMEGNSETDSNIAKVLQGAENRLAALAGAIENSEDRLAELRTRVPSAASGVNPSTELFVQLFQLQEDAEGSRRLYESYLARLKNIEQQRGLVLPSARVVAQAIAPVKASFPPRRPIFLAALCIGLGLGLAIAWFRDTFVRAFATASEVERASGVDVIAEIPAWRSMLGRRTDNLQDSIVKEPFSPFAESVRRLKTTLDLMGKGSGDGKIVAIMSTSPGEGKSVLAVALARAAALAGDRALLIDCDLHQPSLAHLLNLQVSNDLRDFLKAETERIDFHHYLASDILSPLSVILTEGGLDPSETLLTSHNFTELLAVCRQEFTITILDSPPVKLVSDALLIGSYADSNLFVISADRTPQKDVLQALKDLLRFSSENKLAAVLNGVAASRENYTSYRLSSK